MMIHLKGGDISNRGDVLMLRTVVNQLSKSNRQPRLSVHNHFVPFAMRSRLGLRQTIWFPDYRRLSGLVGYPILKRYRKTLGLTLPEEIDWIFDLSGFCYTDHWGARNAVNMRNYLNKQRKYDTRYVVLPQAFGPFEEAGLAKAFTDVANAASILFVRDDRSREYVEGLGVRTPIKKAPDITTIAPSTTPSWCESERPYVCIVPNSRMVEEREGDARASYIHFLVQVCEALDQQAPRILFLLFEGRDRELLAPVSKALGRELLYVEEDDPVRLRGILGEAQAVVASRYHALVSALSQGVFALGTSWSHKYEELFSDYGCEDLLIPSVDDRKSVRKRLDILLDPSARDGFRNRIAVSAADMKERASEMWARIGEMTGLSGIDQLGNSHAQNVPKGIEPPEC